MSTLTIETDNAAFGDDPAEELASILRRLASNLTMLSRLAAPENGKVRDSNGNTVGTWSLS